MDITQSIPMRSVSESLLQAASNQDIQHLNKVLEVYSIPDSSMVLAFVGTVENKWVEETCRLISHAIHQKDFLVLMKCSPFLQNCPLRVWQHILSSLEPLQDKKAPFVQDCYAHLLRFAPTSNKDIMQYCLLSDPAKKFNRMHDAVRNVVTQQNDMYPDLQSQLIATLTPEEGWSVLKLLYDLKTSHASQSLIQESLETYLHLPKSKDLSWWVEVEKQSHGAHHQKILHAFEEWSALIEEKIIEHHVSPSWFPRVRPHPKRKI